MPAFNVREAKTNFSKLLDCVLEGEEVLITRNGLGVNTQKRPPDSTRARSCPLVGMYPDSRLKCSPFGWPMWTGLRNSEIGTAIRSTACWSRKR